MSAVNAKDVMQLRDRTSLPMMECKAALTEAGGDMEKAIQILREKNAKATIKRADRELLRDVCMHITAVVPTPAATRREDVPADVVAKEKEIIKAQTAADPKSAGKPANLMDKIAEGKINAWYKDNVLVEQPFVKDDSKTVGQVLKSAGLEAVRFARFKVGEVVG